jgi:hypothetical protein
MKRALVGEQLVRQFGMLIHDKLSHSGDHQPSMDFRKGEQAVCTA